MSPITGTANESGRSLDQPIRVAKHGGQSRELCQGLATAASAVRQGEPDGDGDCYEAAAKLLMEHRDCPGIALAHGTVTGQGAVAGIRYGHAWVEIGDAVLDPSNGRLVVARKPAYYAAGEIAEPVARYTFAEAAREMLETGHYGPWEKRLSPNTPRGSKRSHTPDKRGTSRPLSPHKTGRPSPPEKW